MVVVIGAGITGLAAAFELSKRRLPVLVLERAERAGGLILTDRVDGFTIEAGADSLLVQKPAALQLCEELGLGPRLLAMKAPRRAYVLKTGRLHALPSPSILGIPTTWSGIARYDLLSPWARARLAVERLIPPAREMEDESVAAFFRRRFGAATVGTIAAPLLGGIHAGDVERLSVRSLFPRLIEAEARRGSVIRAFARRNPHAAGEGLFRALAGGMSELIEVLVRRLPQGTIRLATAATAIERGGTGWRVVSESQSFPASAVILAAPAHAAAGLLAPLDPRAAALCAEIPYVSTASVALVWPRDRVPHPLAGSGFVVARPHATARITACTWVSSKWSGRAPEGTALLRAFIGGAHDSDAASLSDEALTLIACRDISSVLGITSAPTLTRVYRWLDAGAQHNVGQLARMAELEQRLASLPGILVAGSGFRSIGIPDCIADGRAAADSAARHCRLTIGD